MGPLSGLFVAPIVGVLSDRCRSPFGRRRPFMLGGAIAAIIGMTVFANAAQITFGNLPLARVLAVLSFGVLDFATNAIMFPSRALLGDLLPAAQQHDVQSAAAVVASVAEICGGAYIFAWKDPVTHVSHIFAMASLLLAVSTAVSLVVCEERPMRDGWLDVTQPREGRERSDGENGAVANTTYMSDGGDDDDIYDTNGIQVVAEIGREMQDFTGGEEITRGRHTDTARTRTQIEELAETQRRQEGRGMSVWLELGESLKNAIVNFPRPLIKVGIVYGLAWFQWFASLPFYSHWLGVDVLHGDPTAKAGSASALAYQQGVTVFSVASMAKALLAMVFAAFYPTILEWVGAVGERVVFGLAFLIFSTVLFALAFTRDVYMAAMVIALGSVPFILTQTIPIAMVVQRFPEHLASNLGVLNLFCVVPQLIDTLYAGKVAEVWSESVLLRVASCWGFVTAIAAFLLLS